MRRPRPIPLRFLLALAAGLALLVACSVGDGPSDGRPGSSAATAPPGSAALVCDAPIDRPNQPTGGYVAVADVVALDLNRTLQAAPDPTASPYAYYAKSGLLVRSGAQFDLVVPPDEQGRLGLRWANVGGQPITEHLRVTGCRSGDAVWLAYPGGFYVTEPGCLRLDVRVGGRIETVRVSIGAPCAGVPGLVAPT